jgi:hypothetical protein
VFISAAGYSYVVLVGLLKGIGREKKMDFFEFPSNSSGV